MITLYGTGPLFGLPHASPFAIKVELLLKLSGLPYKVVRGDIRKAPRGKIPWIEDNGQIISDSRLIKHHLETRHGVDFSGGYAARDLGMGLAIERMFENHFYWFNVENRWLVPENFQRGPANFLKAVPALIRPLITRKVLGKVRRDVATQGQHRLTEAEKQLLVGQALRAMEDVLADRTYVLGDKPSGVDATAYGFLVSAEAPLFDSPYGDALRKLPALMGYLSRMTAEFFPAQ